MAGELIINHLHPLGWSGRSVLSTEVEMQLLCDVSDCVCFWIFCCTGRMASIYYRCDTSSVYNEICCWSKKPLHAVPSSTSCCLMFCLLGICSWRGAGGVSCTWYPSFERLSYLTAFDPCAAGGEAFFFSRVMCLIEGIDTDSSW